MRQVFDIDCLGPLRVVRFLLPALTAGQAVIANISSKMGSVSDNTSGGSYAYRAAKGALVGVSRSMAVDLIHSGVRVLTLHPGWVRTDMTGHNGLIDVDESVAGMTDVISRAEDYTPGEFIAFDGKVIPY
jgi:NAD(P)-dependent dehydrogenase (short-subunit alcohol dehydrogenase family)